MGAVNFRTAAAGFALGLLALAATAPLEVRAEGVDPAAMQILRRMTDYLGSLQRFSLDTQSTYEDVLDSGQKIQYDLSTSVVIQRPNKLRGERKGDLVNQVIVYDGKTLTVFNPKDKQYAVKAVPDNLDDMLHFARDSLDLVPPAGDINLHQRVQTADGSGHFGHGRREVHHRRCQLRPSCLRRPPRGLSDLDRGRGQAAPAQVRHHHEGRSRSAAVHDADERLEHRAEGERSLFRFKPPQGAREVDFAQLDTVNSNSGLSLNKVS